MTDLVNVYHALTGGWMLMCPFYVMFCAHSRLFYEQCKNAIYVYSVLPGKAEPLAR